MMKERFQKNRSLKECTTFGIGGEAKYFFEVHTIEEMKELIKYCHQEQLPYFILGKGSNTLFNDLGFNGLVIVNKIDFLETNGEGRFYVGAGYSFSLLGSKTAKQGWGGLEFASGIPASVGGAVYMNAGANGHETSETLVSVDYINANGELIVIPRYELEYAYRHSSFQKWSGAIVAATFQLSKSTDARNKQLEIITYRKNTQPYSAKSAGCVFRNPTGFSAGGLIDQSGLKGAKVGGAEVSTVHANFLINRENASAKDILELIELIKKEVKDKKGIDLENEVRCVPYT